MSNIFTVILAGGSGTRFWPLSRQSRPKQLLALAGEESLVRETQRRLETLVPTDRRLVITNRAQAPAVAAELEGLVAAGHVLSEPMGRDTAAAVVLGALAVRALDPDGIMVVLPADHCIEPADELVRTLRAAAEIAAASPTLVTIGIRPDHAATGYGYIKRGAATGETSGLRFHRVESFREKPDLDTAAGYVADGGYYWNSGMFVWAARTILDLAARFIPDTLAQLEPLVQAGRAFPGPEELQPAFEAIRKISVDYAILEQAPDVQVVEAPFAWDDVGAWTAVEKHAPQDEAGNAVRGSVLMTETRRTTVHTADDHLVATLGVEDLVIVHTPDATLVAHKDRVQAIKDLVESLRARGREDLI